MGADVKTSGGAPDFQGRRGRFLALVFVLFVAAQVAWGVMLAYQVVSRLSLLVSAALIWLIFGVAVARLRKQREES